MAITAPQKTLWERRVLLSSYVSMLRGRERIILQCHSCSQIQQWWAVFVLLKPAVLDWESQMGVFVDGGGVLQKEQILYRLPNSGPRNTTAFDFGVILCLVLHTHMHAKRQTISHCKTQLAASLVLPSFAVLPFLLFLSSLRVQHFFPSPEQLPKE